MYDAAWLQEDDEDDEDDDDDGDNQDELSIMTPNHNSSVRSGSAFEITWTNAGRSNLMIQWKVSTHDQEWTVLVSDIAGEDEAYSWQVPEITTSDAVIRIVNAASQDAVLAISEPFAINSTTPVHEDHIALQPGRVFPNPASGGENWNLELAINNSGSYSVSLISLAGAEVYTSTSRYMNNGVQHIRVPAHNLNSGVYILRLMQDKRVVQTMKLLRQ